MNHVIIGTAGHVDHGKTCLIKALTGIDTDRLAEEKKRGITIELGFASLKLPDGTVAGIVDVPGHERFIRNMLAGAGGIDIAMLIVAADEGVMPQTREHLSILSLLNIPRGIIVITKCDTVEPDWVELVKDDIKEAVSGTFLEGADMVPVSAFTGMGLDELKAKLMELAAHSGGKDLSRPFRLPADRVFTLGGFGTVITGTLIEGTLKEGDEITLYPSGLSTRARSIQVHSKDVKEAYGGQRVAVNLAGIKREDIERGEVIAAPGSMVPSMMADVYLSCILMDREVLHPGESCYAQLRLEESFAAKRGDRFVVRFYSPVETVGGGEILDPCPLKHRRGDKKALSVMEIKHKGDKKEIVSALISEHSRFWTPVSEIAVLASFTLEETKEQAGALEKEGKAVMIGRDICLDMEYVKKIRRQAVSTLSAYHKANPLRGGMKREELRSRLLADIRISDMDSLINYFISSGSLKEQAGLVSLSSFKVEAGEKLRKLMEEISAIYKKAGYTPPATDDVIAQSGSKQASQVLEAMVASGALVRLDAQINMDAGLYGEAKEKARSIIDQKGQVTLGEFRDALGTSRKYAVALLESFDKARITKMTGEGSIRA